MKIKIRAYQTEDLPAMTALWNGVVIAGNAFPQEETMTNDQAAAFFAAQSFTGVAEQNGKIAGLYILHPNYSGRLSHIANASYCVDENLRGAGIGEQLVLHSLQTAKALEFKILQFNAVVASNTSAMHLYEKLGFVKIGVIPGGYRNKAGVYENMCIYYHTL